ncbi:NADH:ubiquinone oxidoreductase subunit M [Desulfolithobacter dissulfuricans]|uniref:NADH:ubiquinone oxidoreductase subunit M n=2 Tax=Desulfolithobacter dissulfuricans TaxID=2795293 RepID=A0A915XLG6_9BACT|nr:NADH:ubiquinone oxidoreductase subunit M [Desulfolithobacter dissulfuricans]
MPMSPLAILHPSPLDGPYLSLIIFLPIIGAFLLFLIRSDEMSRWLALIILSLTFLVSLPLYSAFQPELPGFQFVENHVWIRQLGLSYLLGVDGISLPLVLLTTFLGPSTVLCSWRYINKRVREFMACLLLTQGILTGVFVALDLVLFYFFWEAMLIPMFLIIAIWGGPRRMYAAIKFVLYTLGGSIFLLLAIVGLYIHGGTFSYPALLGLDLAPRWEFWLFLAFLVGFAVKIPMVPLHTWLPAAHVEAPTAGSVILASVLLKMGTYGLLRFNLTLTPAASVSLAPVLIVLSVAAILYGGLLSLAQQDIKKLIAYSSVAHMGFVTLGIGVLNMQGFQGAMLQMLNHGLTTGGLFLLVGMLYERTHSRELADNAGLARLMPGFVFFLGLFSLSSLAFPGTASFVGEFLCLSGAFSHSLRLGAWVIPGALLAAAYMFRMFIKLTWGRGGDPALARDIGLRELASLLPLAILVIVFGLYPAPLLKIMNPALESISARLHGQTVMDLSAFIGQALPPGFLN